MNISKSIDLELNRAFAIERWCRDLEDSEAALMRQFRQMTSSTREPREARDEQGARAEQAQQAAGHNFKGGGK